MRDEQRKPPVVEGDVIAGKYRVDRVIGSGGMGIVVAATHTALDQRVALKFILPEALKGPESLERFLREARASVRLKSEHVARVYDVGTLDGEAPGAAPQGTPFIVMELLEGSDLTSLAKRCAPVPVADAAEYVLQACEALIEAHAHGIIHRDLKPQNLFVCRRINGSPLVKVLDFGIFKAVGPAAMGQLALTDSTVVLGSPLYMAPEQMRAARNADARSDIWSLGVILYELLAGRVPFDGETVTELCLKVAGDEPQPLVQLREGLPEGLVTIVSRCLEKDPQKRFATVAQLAAALEPFSASAQRGALDRPWRSLVDTVDQLDLGQPTPESAPLSSGEKARTAVTWGGTGRNDAGAPARKRTFVGGLAVGALLVAASAGGYVAAMQRHSQPAAPPMAAAATVPLQPAHPSVPSSLAPQREAVSPVSSASAPSAAQPALAAPPPSPPRARTGSRPARPPAPPPASASAAAAPVPLVAEAPPPSAAAPAPPPPRMPNGAPILK